MNIENEQFYLLLTSGVLEKVSVERKHIRPKIPVQENKLVEHYAVLETSHQNKIFVAVVLEIEPHSQYYVGNTIA